MTQTRPPLAAQLTALFGWILVVPDTLVCQITQAAGDMRARPSGAALAAAAQVARPIVAGIGWDWTTVRGGLDMARLVLVSNIAGAILGGAAGGVGLAPLKDYLGKNLAVGVGFPFGSAKLTSVLQFGLGELNVTDSVKAWFTVTFEQLDRADRRVSPALRQDTVPSWTSLSLTVGVLAHKIWKRAPVAMVFLGVGAPHFYPGSPVPAVGALFSENHRKYRREGPWRFMVGIQMLVAEASP